MALFSKSTCPIKFIHVHNNIIISVLQYLALVQQYLTDHLSQWITVSSWTVCLEKYDEEPPSVCLNGYNAERHLV